jgi:carbonic anhydrase
MADEQRALLRVAARHLLQKGHLPREAVRVLARLEATVFLETHSRRASQVDVQAFLGKSDILRDLVAHSPDDWASFHEAFTAELRTPSHVRVAAKYQNKKKVKTQKGDEAIIYEYSEGQVQHRNREKAKRVEKLRKNIDKLRRQVTGDLDAKDPDTRLAALAVALIDETYERVGNEDSAKDGHFGVTGWKVKHVTFSQGKATLSYVGKSGVKQTKTVTNSKALKVLKDATKGKDPDEELLCEGDDCRITADKVNDYLKPFGVTAKDLRGLHANEEMRARLKAERKGKLPEDKKKREEKLKAEFAKALEGAAAAVGHEPSTLKGQYLVPGLEDAYLKDGTIPAALDKTAISHLHRAAGAHADMCSLSWGGRYGWIDPKGKRVPINTSHLAWAEGYLAKQGLLGEVEKELGTALDYLLRRGWVRVVNFRNFETARGVTLSAATLRTLVQSVVQCLRDLPDKDFAHFFHARTGERIRLSPLWEKTPIDFLKAFTSSRTMDSVFAPHVKVAGSTLPQQSPVDLPAGSARLDPPFQVNYSTSPLVLDNKGHTVDVFEPGSTLTYKGKVYGLTQFHFHSPSEHTIDGEHLPMEMHIVHEAADGSQLVLGVFIEEGASNHELGKVVDNIPMVEDMPIPIHTTINAEDLLPAGSKVFTYRGSLTTPPYTEGVRWFIYDSPIQASARQIREFQEFYLGDNRPTQPLNGRQVQAVRTGARHKCVPEGMQLLDYVRGYKQISRVRRIPIAKEGDTVIVGLEEIQARGLQIRGKPYMGTREMEALFSDEVVVEEKVDGHPMVALYEGYTFFCESLKVRHSVDYDACPYSALGWPDMLVVYEVLDGEYAPPYTPGFGTGKWLTRSEKEAVCRMVGAPLVPLVFKGKIRPQEVPSVAQRLSSFGGSEAEGVVIKNLKRGIFGKFVNIEFQQKLVDEDTWGGVHPEQRGIRNVRRRATAHIRLADIYLMGTKTHAEREDEEAAKLVRPSPKKKPPRHDLRNERMDTGVDVEDDGDDKQDKKDQSQNYKNIGASSVMRVAYQHLMAKPNRQQRKRQQKQQQKRQQKRQQKKQQRRQQSPTPPTTSPSTSGAKGKKNTVWVTDTGKIRAMDPDGNTQSFSSKEKAQAWLDGGGSKQDDAGAAPGKGKPKIDMPEPSPQQQQAERRERQREEQQRKQKLEKDLDAIDLVLSGRSGAAKKTFEGFSGKQQEVAATAYGDTTTELVNKPPTSAKALAELAGLADAAPGPGVVNDPEKLGEFLAKQQYARKVVANPMMVGGQAVSDDDEAGNSTEEQIKASQERAEQAYHQYSALPAAEREDAFYELNAALLNATKGSPRHTELRGLVNGVAFSMAMAGERVPFMANVPQSFGALGAAMKEANPGSEMKLLSTVTSLPATDSRGIIGEALSSLDDETLFKVAGGKTGPMGEWVKALTSGEKKVYTDTGEGTTLDYKKLTNKARKEMLGQFKERLVDTMTFVDPLVGEVLKASGGKVSAKAVAELSKGGALQARALEEDPVQAAQNSRLEWFTNLHTKLKPKVESAGGKMSELGGALWSMLSDVEKTKSTGAVDEGVHGPVAEAAGVASPTWGAISEKTPYEDYVARTEREGRKPLSQEEWGNQGDGTEAAAKGR